MEETLRQRLESAFVVDETCSVAITALEGCGDSFEVRIVSSKFEGTKRLQRHKMVNEAVGDLMVSSIHALTISLAKTPAETAS